MDTWVVPAVQLSGTMLRWTRAYRPLLDALLSVLVGLAQQWTRRVAGCPVALPSTGHEVPTSPLLHHTCSSLKFYFTAAILTGVRWPLEAQRGRDWPQAIVGLWRGHSGTLGLQAPLAPGGRPRPFQSPSLRAPTAWAEVPSGPPPPVPAP